jgi:signal transduction histidine kinase
LEILPFDQFDREYTIHDLLKNIDCSKLHSALTKLLNGPVRLLDPGGGVVFGDSELDSGAMRAPLTVQLEAIAYLEAAHGDNLEAAAALLIQLLKSSERYHMASELHLESVHSDYEKLQQQHSELQASEARYKELAAHLEQRVQEQVETIEKTQRHLFQTEKLASVGQLAAGVAHEINNPVGFILSNLNTARGYTDELAQFLGIVKAESLSEQLAAAWQQHDIDFILEDFVTLLRESIDGAERVAAIVANLKEFSNVDGKEKSLVDINSVIESVINVASTQIVNRAELTMSLAKLPMLNCRPGHISQVLLNMLLNSASAMGESRGEIHIDSNSDGQEITIQVSDNGRGIPPEIISTIFDPFFTTHDVGGGTGLGLSVARDVIVAHGGTIDVASRVGEGTTFTIHLPIVPLNREQ